MANAHVTFGGAMGGNAPVYASIPDAAQTIASTSSSAASTITAQSGNFARIAAFGGGVFIAVGPSPVAASGAGYYVADGGVLDLGPLKQGDKVAVIDA